MSDPRVALIAEGPTDAIVIGAALKALLNRPFILTLLQPEPTRPRAGTGWGGVLRWCQEFASRGCKVLESDPTLPGFDLFVLHIDADVTEGSYEDVSPELASTSRELNWPVLPRPVTCPPPDNGVNEMRRRLLAWARLDSVGPDTVLCIPSKSIEAWLTAAMFADGHKLLQGLECNLMLEAQLTGLPKTERIKKTQRAYSDCENAIREHWPTVRTRCSQADRFSNEVLAWYLLWEPAAALSDRLG